MVRGHKQYHEKLVKQRLANEKKSKEISTQQEIL